jgi:hypothetical protein
MRFVWDENKTAAVNIEKIIEIKIGKDRSGYKVTGLYEYLKFLIGTIPN